jgi:hypothetical protein
VWPGNAVGLRRWAPDRGLRAPAEGWANHAVV